MTVKELMEILKQANPDDNVFVTQTYYNGWREVTNTDNPKVYLTNEGITISDEITIRSAKIDFVEIK